MARRVGALANMWVEGDLRVEEVMERFPLGGGERD